MHNRLGLALFIGLLSSSLFARTMHLKDSHHELTVLNHGHAALIARLELIETAKKSIEWESYEFWPGKSTRLLLQALERRAKEGVEVRVLLDKLAMNKVHLAYTFKELSERGIKIKIFNTKLLARPDFRTHRKILVVDRERAIVGGRNIGDHYMELGEEYNFLDRDVLIEGEIAQTISDSFLDFFQSKWADERPNFVSIITNPRFERDRRGSASYRNWWRKKRSEKFQGEIKNLFIGNKSDETLKSNLLNFEEEHFPPREELGPLVGIRGECRDVSWASNSYGPKIGYDPKYLLNSRIAKIRNEFFFDTPIFTPSREQRKLFNDLLKRKVGITVYSNGLLSSDLDLIAAGNADIRKWAGSGAKLYVHTAKALDGRPLIDERARKGIFGVHSKTYLFDRDAFAITSYNWDNRSEDINLETVFICENSPELQSQIRENMESRLKESLPLGKKAKEFFHNASFMKKLKFFFYRKLAVLIRPLM